MARDPIDVLIRLRALATRGAKRDLGTATRALAMAEGFAAEAAAAPAAEQAAGADPLLLTGWMPQALHLRDRAAARARQAEAARDAAQAALAEARRQERVLELLAERRAAEAARAAARKAQAALDDRAQRRRGA
ncbi:MAG TPA: hypothetical protein VGM87_25670 [Roseomonas sp.]|jgi:flagellar export protein FliJ